MLQAQMSVEGKESRKGVVGFSEADYTVKNLETDSELYKSYRLRHRVFCEELNWVPCNEDGEEKDHYDETAVPLGVLDTFGGLSAYLRLLMPGEPFMIEKEFSCMVDPGHRIRREDDTAEISRLCISPEARHDFVPTTSGSQSTSVLLLKGIHRWCALNGIRYLYAVTEYKVYKLACFKGFPFKLVGKPTQMPDGVVAVAMILDWREFEEINRVRRPTLIEWFNQYRSARPQGQPLSHEPALLH